MFNKGIKVSVHVAVDFLFQVIFVFLLFLGMVMTMLMALKIT